jgi:hypothetical protein
MLPLNLAPKGSGPLQVLCLGAHSDDIKIGCGGTILELLAGRSDVACHWVVLSSDAQREKEARASAAEFLKRALRSEVAVQRFRNGYFPFVGDAIKDLSFDGTTDYVRAPNSSSLNIAGPGLTIEMWANITGSSATDYVLLSKPWTTGTTGNPPYQYGIEYDANGLHTLDFYFGDATSATQGPFSITPSLGTWTHLAFTFDGSTVKGYLDGVLKLSTPTAANIQARPTDLLIGEDGALGQGFNGKLDDVRLYNRALTQLEVQTDMGRPAAPAVPPVPDGTFGTSMKATRASVDGSTIGLTWDVSGCVAKGYHAVYGPLANLATYQIAGGVCGMGATGSFSWAAAPAGDLWFVIVADDLNGTEGSWGNRSAGGAMNGFVPSSVCGMTNRVNLSSCP